ncbi:Protein-export membrane protein SecG OS=Streptomyces glaucescens OX=1907 GN=SGLAU_08725 PE=3 SV=1 [Streptomyces glaucescens]
MGFSIALIVFSLLLMLLVLMHKGKGGGLSDMFGGGMQSSVGGSSVAERNLDLITVVVGLLWFACIVVLGLLVKVGWNDTATRPASRWSARFRT